MLQSKIITVDTLKTRLALRRRGKNKVTIAQRASSSRLNEVLMKKYNVDQRYLRALQAFTDRLAEDQTRTLLDEGKENEYATIVTSETGRRFDKIYVGTLDKKLHSAEEASVRYFVERQTGIIYGAKSDLAPNLKWYFSTIYEADKWDWSGMHGEPKSLSRAGVKVVGGYGGYKHYERVEQEEQKEAAVA